MKILEKAKQATEAWQARRGLCERCRHCLDRRDQLRGMRCRATLVGDIAEVLVEVRNTTVASRHSDYAYCIDARLPRAKCGPDGRLFEER